VCNDIAWIFDLSSIESFPTSFRNARTSLRSGPISCQNCAMTIAMPTIVMSNSADKSDNRGHHDRLGAA
jgi:hypothetical protein